MTHYALCSDETDVIADKPRVETGYSRLLPKTAPLPALSAPEATSYKSLNILRQPALLMDNESCVVELNAAAETVFGPDIQVRDRRLFIRDAVARARLQTILSGLVGASAARGLPAEPIIVPRQEKLPVLLRVWPFDDAGRPSRKILALVLLNPLGPRPGPPANILATAFSLTPSEARLACIIARGAGPDVAARELKISRETARNQLKSIFAKTGAHRQSELVALLLQVL